MGQKQKKNLLLRDNPVTEVNLQANPKEFSFVNRS